MSLTRKGRRRLGAVTVVTCAALIAQNAAAATAQPDTVLAAADDSLAAVPDRYTSQRIAWEPCFSDPLPEGLPAGSERLECGTFATPRDWAAPDDGPDLEIAVSRLRPTGGSAERSILTNPGGPGGPGLTLPLIYLQAGRTALTESREIVGVDPRGTGASTNVTCNGGTGIGATLDPRDRSEVNIELILDSAALGARTCQYAGRDLTKVITTEQTVRDLDLLRALLDRDTIDWIGYSGGTWLGAAYATYFPARVGRFVLDANAQFTADWQQVFNWQPLGFQRRFGVDFLPWAARYDERFDLGATPQQVRRTYEDLRARLAQQPLDLFGLLDIGPVLLDQITIQSMYSKFAFSDLADIIGLIRDLSDGTLLQADADPRAAGLRAALLQAQERGPVRTPLAVDAFSATFVHITCNDTPNSATRQSLRETSAEQGRRYPLVGYYTLYDPCAFWDRTGVPTLAPRTGEGVPDVQMVQNDRDPATPIEGAVRANRDFGSAKMITVRDEGDHTIYPGNPCVDSKVEAFLLGTAPAVDATCQGLGLPEPTPLSDEPAARSASAPAAGTPLERARALREAADR